jgi:thiol-disulfide isomerase/thioredoxin
VAHVVGPLAILLVAPASGMMDSTPAEELARLKKEVEAAWGELDSVQKPGATEAEQKAAYDRYSKQAAALARRALALAEAHPDAPEALGALIWILDQVKTADECDAAYDLMARRHLDKDSLLPIIRTAWNEAPSTAHVEAFLRAAVERSPNLKVKSLSCFSLGRHQQELAWFARVLNHPIRGKRIEEQLGPEKSHRLRSIKPEALEREAEALFERTIKEYADVRPMKDFPPLGEQAEAALFQMRNLEIGCTVPEIGGEDVDGKPMKLSDYRGKVVVITFWATWCGPCMGLVPGEKALVERMKGRPFVLIGVNGDDDRAKAKTVSAKEGINWRSFWDGGRQEGTAVKWGVSAWPTVYLIDAKGMIRDDSLVGHALDQAVETLVAEAESAAKKP